MRPFTVVMMGGALALAAAAHDARACGGCFHEAPPPPSPSEPAQNATIVTDHRMIFAVSPQQTTLYDQVEYSGAPSSFAWVLPIHGPVSIALSSEVLFAALNAATQTTIVPPVLPPCSPPPSCGGGCPSCEFGGDDGGNADFPEASTGGGSSGAPAPPRPPPGPALGPRA